MRLALAVLLITGASIAHQGLDAKAPEAAPAYTVRVIYFYPADNRPDQKYIKAINPFVRDIREWYRSKLGVTFYAEPVVAIKGKLGAAGYGTGNDVWVNVFRELGVECGTNKVTLIFFARSLQHANGRNCAWPAFYNSSQNGDVTVSEAVLDAELVAVRKGSCPNGWPLGDWRCSPQASRGGVAHELGHAFSLPHPYGCETYAGTSGYEYCDRTIMYWFWPFWPNVGFLEEGFAPEVSTLRSSPWFY